MICNSIDDLIFKLKKYKTEDIIFTNGCFDIIHSGHIQYLKNSKELGKCLVVGLNSDKSVRKLKGESRPINNQSDRAIVLDELKSVDFVIIFDEDTPYNLINSIRPFVITKGGDYQTNNVVGKDVVESYGGRVELINFVEGKSSTNVIEKLKG